MSAKPAKTHAGWKLSGRAFCSFDRVATVFSPWDDVTCRTCQKRQLRDRGWIEANSRMAAQRSLTSLAHRADAVTPEWTT